LRMLIPRNGAFCQSRRHLQAGRCTGNSGVRWQEISQFVCIGPESSSNAASTLCLHCMQQACSDSAQGAIRVKFCLQEFAGDRL
jgi:hypothetical protein